MKTLLAPLLALAVTAGTLTAVAQTKSDTQAKSTSKKSKYHRLPAHFAKLELKEEQRTDIYSIKDDFGPRIDELKAELAALQEEMNSEIEDVLTTTQKSELAKLRGGTSKTASASKSSSDDDKSSSKSSSTRRTSRKKKKDTEESAE